MRRLSDRATPQPGARHGIAYNMMPALDPESKVEVLMAVGRRHVTELAARHGLHTQMLRLTYALLERAMRDAHAGVRITCVGVGPIDDDCQLSLVQGAWKAAERARDSLTALGLSGQDAERLVDGVLHVLQGANMPTLAWDKVEDLRS